MKPIHIRVFSLLAVTFCLGQSALALSSTDQSALFESYALESQGKVPQALEKMIGLLASNANDYLVNYRLGWLFAISKKYSNATEHYKKAASIAPGSIEAHLASSAMSVVIGDYASAVGACTEVLKRDPKNYTCLQRSAFSLIRLKRYDEAHDKAAEGSKLYPLDAIFLEQQVASLKEKGKLDDAKKAADQLLSVSPKNEYAKSILKLGTH